MKKMIIKLLGLESLVTAVLTLRKENEELKKSLAELTEKVDEIESPDMDNYVSEDDVNDRIESYMNDNDYVTSSYVDDEIESKVSDAVESAVEDLDLTDKVEEIVENINLTDRVETIVKRMPKPASTIEDLDIEEKVRDLFNDASPAPMSEEDIKKEVAEAVKVTLEKMVKALADQQD